MRSTRRWRRREREITVRNFVGSILRSDLNISEIADHRADRE
jgi:hypothetical protein